MHIFNKYLRKNEIIKLTAHNNYCLHKFGENCVCKNIENVDEYRYLGVHIDKNFDMNVHINAIIKKLRSALPQIMTLKYKMNEDILRTLYHAFVYPYITYGICVWGGIDSGPMTRLKKLHYIIKYLKKL